jgi:hypothetical protein
LKYCETINYDFIMYLVVRALWSVNPSVGTAFDWELLAEDRVRQISGIARLPRGEDYARRFPSVETLPTDDRITESAQCAMCGVA